MTSWTMLSHLLVVVFVILNGNVISQSPRVVLPDLDDSDIHVRSSRLSSLIPVENFTTNIIGGTDADEFEYPFAAAFMLSYPPFPDWRARCSGALIHPYWVLTAAHCNIPVGSTVLIGQSDIEQPVDERGMSVSAIVANFIRHPLYAGHSRYGYDVALVRLQYPVHVRPVALEFSSDLTAETKGAPAVAIGYGSLQESRDTLTPKLQEITQHLAPICDCILEGLNSTYGDDPLFVSDTIMSRSLCYMPRTSSSRVCMGDSGGPILTGFDVDSFRVRGVVNFGTGCDPKLPDYYARVSAYTGWITSITGDLSSGGSSETRFGYAIQTEWDALVKNSNNFDAAAHKYCISKGFIAGAQMRQVLPSGVQCFNQSVASILRTTSVGAPAKATNAELRRYTAVWARSRNCSTGIWNGRYHITPTKVKKMEIICILKDNANIFTVQALKTDLLLDSSITESEELFDRVGLQFSRTIGFQSGVWNGEVNETHVGLVVIGSSYSWSYSAPVASEVRDSFEMQTCQARLNEACSLGMIELPSEPTSFSDGWTDLYPNNAKRCWVIPPVSNKTRTTLRFEMLNTELGGDVINVYDISGYSLAMKTVYGMSSPLLTVSGSVPPKDYVSKLPGQTLFVTFESNGAVQSSGFKAYVFHNAPPPSPCSPMLSRAGCKKVKKQCRWYKAKCRPRPKTKK